MITAHNLTSLTRQGEAGSWREFEGGGVNVGGGMEKEDVCGESGSREQLMYIMGIINAANVDLGVLRIVPLERGGGRGERGDHGGRVGKGRECDMVEGREVDAKGEKRVCVVGRRVTGNMEKPVRNGTIRSS